MALGSERGISKPAMESVDVLFVGMESIDDHAFIEIRRVNGILGHCSSRSLPPLVDHSPRLYHCALASTRTIRSWVTVRGELRLLLLGKELSESLILFAQVFVIDVQSRVFPDRS